jgi:hypothetical protein
MQMIIKPEVVVTVRHYSLLNVFKGIVRDVVDDMVTLSLAKEVSVTRFLEGDPIVVAFDENESINITGGILTRLNVTDGNLEFKMDTMEEEAKNRYYERCPVSLYADLKLNDIGKKCFGLIKDISYYGLLIFSKEDLFKGQKMDLDIYLVRDIMSLKAEVTRKVQGAMYYEYGLKIIHKGPSVYNHIQNYVKKAQQELAVKFNRE